VLKDDTDFKNIFRLKELSPYFALIYAINIPSPLHSNITQFPVDTIRTDGNRFGNAIVKYVQECTLPDHGYR